MIVNFSKNQDVTPSFFIILFLFLRLELIELLILLKMYKIDSGEYDYRKIFWASFLVLFVLFFLTLFGFASVLYIVKFFLTL